MQFWQFSQRKIDHIPVKISDVPANKEKDDVYIIFARYIEHST